MNIGQIIIESPYEDLTDQQWTSMSAQERINYSRNRETTSTETTTEEAIIDEDLSVMEIANSIKKDVKIRNIILAVTGGVAAFFLYKKFK